MVLLFFSSLFSLSLQLVARTFRSFLFSLQAVNSLLPITASLVVLLFLFLCVVCSAFQRVVV